VNNIKSVLIIDDDLDDLFLIEERLREFVATDCYFVSSSDKQEAISLLTERAFDLCILDHRLAGYEGIEILNAVALSELATPIIMLTGQNNDEVAKRAIQSGAQDFVMKSSIDDDIFEKSVHYAISRKELEFARLFALKSEAENVAKDKFIAHLSHELRTPLTSILGYTSLLLEKEDTSSYQKELKIISNNGKHLLSLLNDILDLSKIAVDKFELREEPTDFQELLIEVNSLLSVSALDKGLFLEFDSSTMLPRLITLDGVRFKQALVNLVGNAIKFTDRGGVTVTASLIEEKEETQLSIEINDTGIGIAEDKIKGIFTPFKQLEDVADRKAGGAGLGLSITAEIVKKMGGELIIESRPAAGSLFTLKMPCNGMSHERIKYNFNLSYDNQDSLKTPRYTGHVLVVDDVFEIRQLAGYFIKETGVQVEFANNGEQALSKVAQAEQNNKPIDVIFMDLHMPVLTGKETVKALREKGNTCCIVAMTAAISKGLHNELLQDGFDHLIAKPLDKQELWEMLKQVLPSGCSRAHHNKTAIHSPNSPLELIHLVEDDPDSAAVMQMLLEQLGYAVVHSSTALQAIANSQANSQISHHLLDLGLPDLQGEAFIRKFFERTVLGKVTILSGSQPDHHMLEHFPIAGHLIKPISKKTLQQWLVNNNHR